MRTGRLEAFSDGVIAIIITIMVLDLKIPHGSGVAELKPLLPTLFSYVLSFVYVGIYWNNHHHMFQVTERVTGGILWANLHLLFWLSLTPFVTGWMGENDFAPVPTAFYGVVLLMCAIAYVFLQMTILKAPGGNPTLAAALGRDVKGKFSLVLYVAGIGLCFVNRWLGFSMYVAVALIWLIPDPRIERRVERDV
ncbi:MAG TPA: TMEM175 family protein [Tepidisphaeraceae bacterium]|jgi:uncharacterized membrane protein